VRTFSEGGARRAKGIMRPPPPAPPRTRRAERCSSELRANTRESDIFSSSLQSNDEQIVTRFGQNNTVTDLHLILSHLTVTDIVNKRTLWNCEYVTDRVFGCHPPPHHRKPAPCRLVWSAWHIGELRAATRNAN
jgi:hypothetical protein